MHITSDLVHTIDTADRLSRTARTASTDRLARLTWAERVELRLGLWLLLRSARRHAQAHDHALLLANARAAVDRHHRAVRAHALTGIRT